MVDSDISWRYNALRSFMEKHVVFKAQDIIEFADNSEGISRRSCNYFLKTLVDSKNLVLCRRGTYALNAAIELDRQDVLSRIARIYQPANINLVCSFDSVLTPDDQRLSVLLDTARANGGRVGAVDTEVGSLAFHYVSSQLMARIHSLPYDMVFQPDDQRSILVNENFSYDVMPLQRHTPEVALTLFSYHYWARLREAHIPETLPASVVDRIDMDKLQLVMSTAGISPNTIDSSLSEPIFNFTAESKPSIDIDTPSTATTPSL
jgi:hypothetical protein